MKSSSLLLHLDLEDMDGTNNLGLIVFKPGYSENEIVKFKKYLVQTGLVVVESKELNLSREIVIALYPKIFSFSKDDLKFGISWKQKTIDYLISGFSYCFLVRGESIDEKLFEYKYKLRKRYGKLTHPKNKLPEREFFDRVIKNLVHVVDHQELQNGIWLLFEAPVNINN